MERHVGTHTKTGTVRRDPPAFRSEIEASDQRRRWIEPADASEERYRTLVESMDQGYCIIEVAFDDTGDATDYRFLQVNPAFERQTGLHDASGKWMRTLAPEHEEFWFETYGEVALTGVAKRFQSHAHALGNRWYDVYAVRVDRPEDRHVAILFSDITDRLQSEQKLRDSDRHKDEFLATLAHELRNPLAPLRNGLHTVRMLGQNQPDLIRAIDMMNRQLMNLVTLVDDLLDVARISSGKLALTRAPVKLQDVLARSIEATQASFDARGHELVQQLCAEDLVIDGDADRLRQVFSNLLSNAAKYTDNGGRVNVCLQREHEAAVVRVTDNGLGIPPEELHRLFDLFAQMDTHRPQADGGLGIGLALVRRLVDLHGGTVRAESDGPGHGSTFVVRLPLLRDAAAP